MCLHIRLLVYVPQGWTSVQSSWLDVAIGQIILISARDKEPLPGLNTAETKMGTGKELSW